MSAVVVQGGEGGELLLPGGVPDFELQCAPLDVERLGQKGGADGGHRVLDKVAPHESQDDGGFPDGRLAEQDHL